MVVRFVQAVHSLAMHMVTCIVYNASYHEQLDSGDTQQKRKYKYNIIMQCS